MNALPEPYSKSTVLIVDDSTEALQLMTGLLKDTYRLKVANAGEKALKLAVAEPLPDIILLDVMMPEMDGYEVCRRLKADPKTAQIPIIFLTARTDVEDEKRGFELGAVDYITKPISPPILFARVKSQLLVKRSADFLRDKAAFLEQEVKRRTEEISTIQDVTIRAMATLAETRDADTGNHIRRTQYYVKTLAKHLRQNPRFRHVLSDNYIELLFKSAPLHDIGKVGIPDRILLKPGKHTPEEFEVMKSHTTLGRDAIRNAEGDLEDRVEFLSIAKEIAYSHQEKWDGSGYPEGLSADDIPVSARLMAVADVYDALISRRVYKAPMPHEQAIEIIKAGGGAHFDPDIAEAFGQLAEEIRGIAERFADTDEDLIQKSEQLFRMINP
jgi:putative two-component system response regulator